MEMLELPLVGNIKDSDDQRHFKVLLNKLKKRKRIIKSKSNK